MTPSPQENSLPHQDIMKKHQLDASRIVISGMSGMYPESRNIQEFSDILYNKINPVTQKGLRFECNHPEAVQYAGSVPNIDRFDAQFFKVNFHLAAFMDPLGKIVLEQTYQAIYDAGIHPEQLSGKRVGVFIGSSYSETEKAMFYQEASKFGFGITGSSKSLFSNRISYWLNTKGPSMTIDAACCSSTTALEQAYLAMTKGECEAAIVGGSHLALHPQTFIHYGRVIQFSFDGKTKSFDENADGCAKSEAINVLFLQKEKDALRIYAEVLNVKTEYIGILNGETEPKYGFYRDLRSTINFMEKFYENAKIPPKRIEYVEAFGCGIPEADKVELQAIAEVFCKNRNDPLLVGSIMSNIGYVEASSGISAITKVLLGYHNGKIAANLHCENPRQDIAALREGRMQVVTDHQSFSRTYVAVNGMSTTGINTHVLLHGHYKPKDLSRYKSSIPHLVTISGRHEEAVKYAFEILKSKPIDPEQLALLHSIHRWNIPGHLGRGFVIMDTNMEQETVSLCQNVEYFDKTRQPLWFVYSGMGSQWTGMGAQLMRIPLFSAAIQRCHKALEPKGLNIVDIITSTDEKIFNNILHTFVGIAAIQIGLTDILLALGLKPDGIIGHSVGELGCAYADGCLTAEEMILSAYYRGLVSTTIKFICGSMAAVGMGYEQISNLCPPEIEVACHNGPQSSTLSGPFDIMHEFVTKLTAEGIFAKEVSCSNIAYHSRYIAKAGPHLLKHLQETISSPKLRSERWLSTSVPKSRWNEPISKLCSAEYLTNNLLSPVLFVETSQLIPSNAVLVEIAPHGLLQAILKRSMPDSCTNISLTRRNHPDNNFLLLEAIGKLYMAGYDLDLRVLYPNIDFPVSTGTPFMSNLVKWAHDEKWRLSLHRSAMRKTAANCNFIITLKDKEHAYLKGHSIRGKILYPFAASLTLVWDSLAMILGIPKKELSVEFTDIQLYSQPILHNQRQLKLQVAIHRGTGRFEVLDGNSKVITGFINQLDTKNNTKYCVDKKIEDFHLSQQDIYQILQDGDYSYSGQFQTIKGINESLDDAVLAWQNNWVTFIDGILQLNVLREPYGSVSLPNRIRRICINVKEHMNNIVHLCSPDNMILMPAKVIEDLDKTICGGVIVDNIQFRNVPPSNENKMTLKPLLFASNVKSGQNISLEEACTSPMNKNTTVNTNITLKNIKLGDYESLNWVNTSELTGSGIKVIIHYVGLNNNDLKKANGSLNSKQNIENSYGSDFSGVTENGERVMGIVGSGAASSQVYVHPELVWPVPVHWTLEEAATVPLAYAQALYCLGIKAKLYRGMSVLVHGGAGALGQAVISIALAHDCEVFTTVSDIGKKHFLMKLFPMLKADHILSSRDQSFGDIILTITKGKGCDIIISCVKDYLKDITLKCIALLGICIDVSQLQNQDNYNFGLHHLFVLKNYCTVDFSSIFATENVDELKIISKMLSNGIARGYVRPLSRLTYDSVNVVRAFRLLSMSQHRGRVLLRMKDSSSQTQERLRFSADSSHLVFCNSAAFGFKFTDRLVARGVKILYLHVPTQSNYLLHKIRNWRRLGVNVVVLTANLNEQNISAILNETSHYGPLEGIYMISGAKYDNLIKENFFKNLDLLSRKSCSQLRYFAVLNIGDSSIGKDICLQRIHDQLPVTMLILPDLKEETYTELRSAINATELALQSSCGALLAHVETNSQPSLLQELTTLTGIKLTDVVDKNRTLHELGIQNHKLQTISNFLQVQYNVAFDEEQVSSLTIDDLLNLEKTIIEAPYDNIKGLQAFFNYVDSDEILATTEMVILPTLVNRSSMRDDEFTSEQDYLCIVPGMEGHHERFRLLCESLKIPALVLQPGLDRPHETVREIAERFTKVLLTKTKMKSTFYLLGYESGIFIALEMAAILEEHGLTGTVFCLGCAPDELRTELNNQLAEFKSDEQLQDGVLRHMYKLMVENNTKGLDDALQKLDTWTEKIDTCVRILLGRVSHSAQYARGLLECTMARILQLQRNVATERPLRSQLILLRAIHNPPNFNNLQKHSLKPLVVHQLNTPLSQITRDLQCAAVINEHLDPVILEVFSTMNICDTYLLNADTYMISE